MLLAKSESRRNFLGIGVAGGLALLNNSNAVAAIEGQHRDRPGRAKNVLVREWGIHNDIHDDTVSRPEGYIGDWGPDEVIVVRLRRDRDDQ